MTGKSIVFGFVVSCLFFVFDPLARAQEGYYVLGEQEIEFRLVVDVSEDTKVRENWEEMLDMRGDRFLVLKKAEIGSQDVEAIRIIKSPFEPRERYQISVSFKKESWDKVRNVTERLIGRRLGIVRGNKLISAPVVRTAVDKDAVIAGAISMSDVQWFIAGLVPKEEPPEEDREGEYTKWLEQWVKKSPDDLDAMSALAGKYMYGEKKDYEKASTLFEEILRKDPQRTEHLFNLGTCYTRLGKYDQAVRTYERAIVARPGDEWIARWQLAEAYKGQGKTPRAIRELEKGLRLLEDSSLPDREAVIQAFKAEIENLKRP